MLNVAGRTVQFEDLLLVAWLLVGEPLVHRVFGNMLAGLSLSGLGASVPQARSLAMLFVLSGLAVCATQVTRPPGAISDFDALLKSAQGFARFPLAAAIGLILALGLNLFGFEGGSLALGAVFLLVVPSTALGQYLPELTVIYRRILVTPVILLSTWIFSTSMGAFLKDLFSQDLGRVYSSAQAQGLSGLLVLVLAFALAGSMVYYVLFVYSPRQIAGGGGRWQAWIARYGLYMVGLMLNIGWLGAV